MNEFTAISGAKVKINLADFPDAMALKDAIGREISVKDFDMKLDPTKGINQEFDAANLIKIFLAVDSAPAVVDALFKCLGRCTYNGQRITKETFNSAEAREDYYEIVIACVKANIAPFVKGLFSKLSPLLGSMKQPSDSQK